MENEESWRPWKVYRGLLTPEACVKTIAKRGVDLKPAETEGAAFEERIADGRFFSDSRVLAKVEACYEDFSANVADVAWGGFERFQIVRYQPGGKYDWHADNEWRPEHDRKLACVIALNDTYTGGGTDFLWPNPRTTETIALEQGDALVFLPTLYHRGREVIRGTRWILVTWATGRQFG